jgi:hypothetical protein
MKIAGSKSQRHGSADPDTDPDPHQNVMDPQHWSCVLSFVLPFGLVIWLYLILSSAPSSFVYPLPVLFFALSPQVPSPLSYSFCCPFVSSALSCVSLCKFYIRYLQFDNIGRSVLWIRFSADPEPAF